MLEESISHFMGVGSILLFYFFFIYFFFDDGSDLGLHCLPMNLLQVSR